MGRAGILARCALAFVLACGLVPSTAWADPSADAASDASGLTASDGGAAAEASSGGGQAACVPGQAVVVYRAAAEDDEGASAALRSTDGVDVVRSWDFSAVDEAIASGVVPRPESDAADDEASLRSVDGAQGEDASGVPVGDDVRVALVERPGADARELCAELQEADGVLSAEPNYLLSTDAVDEADVDSSADAADGAPDSASSASPVDDTYYSSFQYSLTSPTAGIDLEAALSARDEAGETEGNVVAVLDTGVDYRHPDLADAMWKNPGIEGLPGGAGDCGYDFGGGDAEPLPSADSHGTHCAGIIAALTDNAEGIAGASSDTRIMALKVDDESGLITLDSIVDAYQYLIGAVLAGENVVAASCSWGGSSYVASLDYLVNQAGRLGVLSVFAAGNEGIDVAEGYSGSTVGLASPYAVVVAATNESNEYADFSNYGTTDVDLAAPGVRILSTVSWADAPDAFNPLLSHLAGKDLACYEDFSDFAENRDAYRISCERGDGTAVPEEEAQRAVSVEATDDAIAGEPGLAVTFDADQLADGGETDEFSVTISWDVPNPFLGEDGSAEDWAIGAMLSMDQSRFPLDGSCVADASLLDPRGDALGTGHCAVVYDDGLCGGAALERVDTTDDVLRAQVELTFGRGSEETLSGVYAVHLAGFGVGKAQDAPEAEGDFVPYASMSGTSMSTPLISGSLGQLAAVHPDASALELRGILVGSTVPVDDERQGAEKETATDGRFSWEVAADPAQASANTWSLSADASSFTATVCGFGLADASVSFDGVAVDAIRQDDASVAFAVPAEAFDGGEHRVDVTDASTGRVHKAAYVLPRAVAPSQGGLSRTGDLPAAAQASTPDLCATEDGLYVADSQAGSYFYRTSDAAAPAWRELAAPGDPWAGLDETPQVRTFVDYASFAGGVAAVSLGTFGDGTEGVEGVVRAAFYDAAADAWTPWKDVDRFQAPGFDLMGFTSMLPDIAVVDGALFVLASATAYESEDESSFQEIRRLVTIDQRTFEATVEDLSEDDLLSISSPIWLVPLSTGLGALSLVGTNVADDGQERSTLVLLARDGQDGPWQAAFEFSEMEMDALLLADWLNVEGFLLEDSLVLAGFSLESLGDVYAFDLEDGVVRSGGSIGVGGQDGVVAASLAAFDGSAYLAGSGPDGAGLYELPSDAIERLAGLDCPTAAFADVGHGEWYHRAVDEAVAGGLMGGYAGTNLFGPDDAITRAQLAQVLYQAAGAPDADPSGAAAFSDCSADAWYAKAVAWAREAGVFLGYQDGSGTFGPDDALTREQAAVVLARWAGLQGADVSASGGLDAYPDAADVSGWAREGVSWAVAAGVLKGVASEDGQRALAPQGLTTRAETAALLTRLLG